MSYTYEELLKMSEKINKYQNPDFPEDDEKAEVEEDDRAYEKLNINDMMVSDTERWKIDEEKAQEMKEAYLRQPMSCEEFKLRHPKFYKQIFDGLIHHGYDKEYNESQLSTAIFHNDEDFVRVTYDNGKKDTLKKTIKLVNVY